MKQGIKTTRRKKNKKIKDSVNSLWDNFKHSNICIIRVPGEDKEQEIVNLFEKIMKENFSNLVKEIDMQVQQSQRVPIKLYPKRTTSRHIIIKMPKVKDKREKFKKIFIVIQLQLYAFSPHPSTPPQRTHLPPPPPPSPLILSMCPL